MEKQTNYYEIRVRGHLDGRRVRISDDISVTHTPDGETLLICPVPDQAALYGLLNRLRDLGVPLVSVNQV